MFVGLGVFCIAVLGYKQIYSCNNVQDYFKLYAVLMCIGILANYGICLIVQSLHWCLILSSSISFLGFLYFLFNHRNLGLIPPQVKFWDLFIASSMVLVIVLYCIPILMEPLSAWDARSIWFFHGKMIFLRGGLYCDAGWLHPSVNFMHVDYPKLLPILAAQVTYVVGYWNEYIPKMSLLFLLMPALLWVFGFLEKSISSLVLILIVPFGLKEWLWNGYMDGYLALYYSIMIISVACYLKDGHSVDIIAYFVFFFMLLNFKNEGLVVGVSTMPFWILMYIQYKGLYGDTVRCAAIIDNKGIVGMLIGILPFIVWNIYKIQWNLTNDLEMLTEKAYLRIYSRIMDGSYRVVLSDLGKQVCLSLFLFVGLMGISVICLKRLAREAVFALMAGGIYFTCLVMVYLATPHDVLWHLKTSSDRTMLAVNVCFFIGCFFTLRLWDEHISYREKYK